MTEDEYDKAIVDAIVQMEYGNMNSYLVRFARWIMKRAFAKDPDFRHAYLANISVTIYDFKPHMDHMMDMKDCDELADKIIKLVYE